MQHHPAVQHTRAVLAQTVLTAAMEVFLPTATNRSKYALQVRKVARWLDACKDLTRSKALSAGARRDLDDVCARLGPWLDTDGLDPEARAHRWAAIWWVGCALTLGVRCTCHLYGQHRHWLWLTTTAWTLGHMLMECFPGCDELGTDIYMEIML